MKKIDKEFCLTDNSVNVYGYRLLSSGLQLERFQPAIGYLMHERSKGVAVRWEDFRFEGDKLFAKPVVNDTLFPDLAEQIESGFYDAASVGHIVALELNDDPGMKLDGQTGPTATKWFPRECSIVDIPGNYNAVALSKLYDENDNLLHDLSAGDNKINITKNEMDMDNLIATPQMLALLNLKAAATQADFDTALRALADKANKADQLQKDLDELKQAGLKSRVADIIAKGKTARKITNEMETKLAADYAENPDGLQALVDSLPAQTLMSEKKNLYPEGFPDKFKNKSYSDLYASGDLQELKDCYPEYYETLKTNK